MPRRIDAAELLAGLGGLLVFVALFLDWFGGGSGWEVFEALDLVLLGLALLAVWSAIASVAGLSSGLPPRALAILGAVALVVVVVQLIEPPPVFSQVDPEREAGAWLALAGAALILIGGVLRAARVSVTVSVGARDTRRRVPAVDRRPGGGGGGGGGGVRVGSPAGTAGGTAPAGGAAGAAAAADEAALRSGGGDDQATQPFVPPAEPAVDPSPEAR